MKKYLSSILLLLIFSNVFGGGCVVKILSTIVNSNPATYSFKVDPQPTDSKYYWSFGDKTISDSPTPTHTFAIKGLYLVSVKVTDNTGKECYGELKAEFLGSTAATPTCVAASNVSVTEITANSARINFTLPKEISSATLEIKEYNTTSWVQSELASLSLTYVDKKELKAATKYIYRLKTVCSNSTINYTPDAYFVTTSAQTTETSCKAASGLSVSNISTNSVKIIHVLPAGISSAYLEFAISNTAPTDATIWTSRNITIPSSYTALGELSPSSKYVYRIKTVCATGNAVLYSSVGEFVTTSAQTTETTCKAASGLSVSNISTNSVKIIHVLPSGISNAYLEFVIGNTTPTDATIWTSRNITIPSTYTVLGELLPATKYIFRIKTVCANGNVVLYSSLGDFSTISAQPTETSCKAASGLSVSHIGTNGVKILYILPTGISSATLEVFPYNTPTSEVSALLSKNIVIPSTYTERGDLLPATKYVYRIKTVCASNGSILYSALGDFITASTQTKEPACKSATNITVSDITSESARFNYTLPQDITSATLEIIASNTSAWLSRSIDIKSTYYDRNELNMSATYYYRIKTVCTNGSVMYSEKSYFKTEGYKSGVISNNASSAETTNELIVSCYPNPATDILSVNILGVSGQMVDLKLTNVYGQVFFESKFPENEEQKIDVQSYPRGIYVLKVMESTKTNSVKIVIN